MVNATGTEMGKAYIRHNRRTAKAFLVISLISAFFLPPGCSAADQSSAKPEDAEVFVPSLFDPRNRPVAPELPKKPIRFLTADDYPPFEFLGPDGALAGYNIEIARALCEELKTSCTIQPRRWDNLLDALGAGEGDAVIASLRESEATQGKARFTAPYYLTPARFVARVGGPAIDVRPEGLRHATIGVEAGSAHEAFLRAFYDASKIKAFADRSGLLAALRGKEIDVAFGDAITLAIWMNSAAAQDCCAFQGGPFLEPAYFGGGIGIALRPDDDALRQTLDSALQRLDERGVMTELYLKYFPVGIY
jgi:polar amino acid transport system substrate-binding protein